MTSCLLPCTSVEKEFVPRGSKFFLDSFQKGTNNFDRITPLECVLFPLKYVFCQQRQLDCFNKGNMKTQYSPLKHNMKPVIFSFSLVFFWCDNFFFLGGGGGVVGRGGLKIRVQEICCIKNWFSPFLRFFFFFFFFFFVNVFMDYESELCHVERVFGDWGGVGGWERMWQTLKCQHLPVNLWICPICPVLTCLLYYFSVNASVNREAWKHRLIWAFTVHICMEIIFSCAVALF